MYITTYTLGCKVNRYETEYLAAAFSRLGYTETPVGASADLVIVNTCTVTSTSDAKSRKAIRHLAVLHPHAEIVVMGCYATANSEQIASEPNVSEVIVDKRDIPEFLRRRGLIVPPRGIASFGERHRAFLKVQDGCNCRCAYCIIPTVRPNLSSRPIDDVVDEVRTLVANGFREIVLTGIHLGLYNDSQKRLHDVVERVVGIDAEFRLRLSSIEIGEVDDALLELMREHPNKICRHLHLPLQSGSDAILQVMRRPYSVATFVERCKAIKCLLPNIALTTDVIVGFPNESNTDFHASCNVVREAGFSKVHVFRYSSRRGTVAASLPNQIPQPTRQQRSSDLTKVADQLRNEYARSQIGKRVQVLPEGQPPLEPGAVEGTANNYLPARLAGQASMIGQLVDAVVTKVDGELLYAAQKVE